MKSYSEVNFDGIPAPYHNYGGLAFGNKASAGNGGDISRPQEAALQALEKAKFLADLGVKQAILPPQLRPEFDYLRENGVVGSEAEILAQKPEILPKLYSSASMWTANAATIAPSIDTQKLSVVTANLSANLHRSIEAKYTHRILEQIFEGFAVHEPLDNELGDEGAANHTRLTPKHGEAGVHIFVYGADTKKFPARQSLEASKKVAELLGVEGLFLKQSPEAIDAGVFHNDVISVGNENVFLYHEKAFADGGAIEQIKDAYPADDLVLIKIAESDLSLEEAVKTYFFNSQIVTLPNGEMIVIAPEEAKQNANAEDLFVKIKRDDSNPISEVHYKNLRQSMRNGGGPACLRLRVVMNDEEISQVEQNANVFLNDELYGKLTGWVKKFYPEELVPEDLYDIELYKNTRAALEELEEITKLSIL